MTKATKEKLEENKINIDSKITELRKLRDEAKNKNMMEDYYEYNIKINNLRDKKDKINQKLFAYKKDLIGPISKPRKNNI